MDRLKKQRATIKGKLTRLQNFSDLIDPDDAPSSEELANRLEYLETNWNDYNTNHELLIYAIDEDDIPAEEVDLSEVEAKYFAIKSKLQKLTCNSDTSSLDDGQSVTNEHAPTRSNNVKLPRLDLPKFSGNILEWTSFHDLFTSMIHNQSISDSQKLHYLKTSVSGEALSLIQSIDVTDANYIEAWSLLKDRYQNERHLVQCHLQSLFSQQSLQKESSTDLRRLLDHTSKCVRALHVLGKPTSEWDAILVFTITDRMDPDSRRQWELHSPGKNYPSFDELKIFIEQRCRALDATSSKNKPIKISQPSASAKSHHSSAVSNACVACNESHSLFQCTKFGSMDVKQRGVFVRKSNLCFNCLRSNHSVRNCQSKSTCRKCGGKHHTLLHYQDSSHPIATASSSTPQPSISNHYSDQSNWSSVLLATAIANVQDSSGDVQQCRILIDGGSQASFITENCMRRLGLRRMKANVDINGIGQSKTGKSRGKAIIIIKSMYSSFSMEVEALVMNQITGFIPSSPINTDDWSHIHHLNLADPSFSIPSGIDILIGADVSDDIVTRGKVAGPPGFPSARNSHLGWILSGRVGLSNNSKITSLVSTLEVDDQLKKFWEIEDFSTESNLSKEEEECEHHFSTTHFRDSSGRYVTALPFKSKCIGFSKSMATRRLQQVEKSLIKDPCHRKQYEEFMEEYLELGHMNPITIDEQSEQIGVTNYLPHHFVLKETSSTTKLRVVFDASSKTSNGKSLNSNLMIGPTVQDEMYDILLRFRLPRYAYTADIAKMYRQVKVTHQDSDMLRILWRKDFTMPMQEFRLLTVTYGTSCAPYTATRTLKQLALDEGNHYPLAAETLLKDFYVDDLMSGHDDLATALETQSQLLTILDKGGFQLRKWSSNDTALLEVLPEDFRETKLPISLEAEDAVKTLGLRWNTGTDAFFFTVNIPKPITSITKRVILSETARLFDPLGLLSPIIIRAKIILQQLWLHGSGWDDEVPTSLASQWIQFREDLFDIEKIMIRRHIGSSCHNYQIHGFSDASEVAYAAVIYLRAELQDGSVKTNLICSKSKVAPTKKLSIPKLELCGALLLTRLLKKVKASLKLESVPTIGWTDSTITLGWISGYPNKWKTFVANRVAAIQDELQPSQWNHVPGVDNPADLPSRGVSPTQLLHSKLWWHGPEWLSQSSCNWPQFPTQSFDNVTEEIKIVQTISHHTTTDLELLHKFSSLNRLIRVTAWMRRVLPKNRNSKNSPRLTSSELHESLLAWIHLVQADAFNELISSLKKLMPSNTQLLSLSPFLDESGTLRVGGRLRNSVLLPDQKNPIILPKNNHLTDLIISREHIKLLHAGPQLMRSSLSQTYWIIGGRSKIRNHVHKCVVCIRNQSKPMHQIMGDLPKERVRMSKPFESSGVDFGGPFSIKSMKGRGGRILKAYICLFVCLSTKAIHIELVGDLTTDGFLAAFKRFMARRGRCTDVFSDNGTNFTGANNELKKLMKQVISTTTLDSLATEGITWHFIPARGPHFGGIWESGIKSTKSHLKKVMGNSILTYEEMGTVLTQIEGCLNSRPLCPMSDDADDLTALTPGHFLIGDVITAYPEPSLTSLPTSRLSRWQTTQQITQHFWKRWHVEYLSTLQQKSKWKKPQRNLEPGNLVLIKEDNLPPTKWMMGRVIDVHPGADKKVRVATLKTSAGSFKRPIVKLILLLTD